MKTWHIRIIQSLAVVLSVAVCTRAGLNLLEAWQYWTGTGSIDSMNDLRVAVISSAGLPALMVGLILALRQKVSPSAFLADCAVALGCLILLVFNPFEPVAFFPRVTPLAPLVIGLAVLAVALVQRTIVRTRPGFLHETSGGS